MKFSKPALTIQQQMTLLESRGLIIEDKAEAEHYLRYIGYYRLSGYALPLSEKHANGNHSFKAGVKFTHILNLYRFDRELRLLVNDAIERIEVAFRTCVSNEMSEAHGAHWYLNSQATHFVSKQVAKDFVQKVIEETGYNSNGNSKGRDVFIDHYFKKYDDPILPPSWMIAEVLSISCWSRLFQSLKREDQKRISAHFDLDPKVLESWMHAISYVRNLCAHHSRLWNRDLTIRPMIKKGLEKELEKNSRFYAHAFVINFLLLKVAPESKWWERFEVLLNEHSYIDRAAMGFPMELVR